MITTCIHRLPAAALLAGLVAATPMAASAEVVGAAGAVNPASTTQRPGAGTRTIELGQQVIQRERIQTTASGSVQLIFIDKTTLNIGPNSDLVIDEFVYNPQTGVGRMAATLGKGVMRFVGGQVSHGGGATVRTPTTTLGIRGGVATISHDGNGTRAINHFGRIEVNANGQLEIVRRPGFSITIPIGQLPLPPQRVTQGDLDAVNRRLTSSGGQSGGARNRPNEVTAARGGLGQTNDRVDPQNLVPLQGQTVADGTPFNPAPTAFNQSDTVREDASNQNSGGSQYQPYDPGYYSLTGRAFALNTTTDPALGSTIPYVLGTAVASGPVYVSPILGYRVDGAGDGGRETKPARVLQAALGINGNGAAQTSNFMVMTGAFVDTPGSPTGSGFYYSGGFRHYTRRGASLDAGRAQGAISSVPGLETVDGANLPTALTTNQNFRNDAGVTADIAFQSPGGGGSAGSYSFSQTVTQGTTPTGLGTYRPFAVGIGFAAGINDTVEVASGSQIEAPIPLTGTATLILNPYDSSAQLSIYATRYSGSAPTGGVSNVYTQMGSIDPTKPIRSTYVDFDNFGGREAIAGPPGPSFALPPVLSEVNGAPVLAHSSAFVSSATVAPAGILSGITFCDCAYTRWGFWSQDTTRTAGSFTYRDRLHLGTWLTGEPASPGDIPTVGSATYAGHVIGAFATGGNQYVAGGQFTNTVNFGTQTGNFQIPSLDGRTYTGTVNIIAGSAYMTGSLSATAGPATTANVFGAFFRGVSGPIGEMGGQINFQGTGYSGAATFLGKN